jgi:hypothetical protein
MPWTIARKRESIAGVEGGLGLASRVVDLVRRDRAAFDEHAASFAQRRRRIGDVLEEPHHPDVVE